MSNKVFSLMQPTFIPWIGYFILINSVNSFVFYDTAEFSRSSWHHKNKINKNNKSQNISLPIKHSGKTESLINSIIVKDRNFKKIRNTLSHSYEKKKDFQIVIDIYNKAYNDNIFLGKANIDFITSISCLLGIKTELLKISDINNESGNYRKSGSSIDDIINCGLKIDSHNYRSPKSATYINDNEITKFNEFDIKVDFFEYAPKDYACSNNSEFLPYLSIIDLIANIGIDKSSEFIKNANFKIETSCA